MFSIAFWIAVGWVLSILFPIPYLNQSIINGYAKFWEYVKTKTNSTPSAK